MASSAGSDSDSTQRSQLFDAFLRSPKPLTSFGRSSADDSDASVPPARSTTKRKRHNQHAAQDNEPDKLIVKKARRRDQNRQAAQNSRDKKKRMLTDLERQVAELAAQNKALMARVDALAKENLELRAGRDPHPEQPSVEPELVNPLTAAAPTTITSKLAPISIPPFNAAAVATKTTSGRKLQPPTASVDKTTFVESAEFAPQQSEVVESMVSMALLRTTLLAALGSLPTTKEEASSLLPALSTPLPYSFGASGGLRFDEYEFELDLPPLPTPALDRTISEGGWCALDGRHVSAAPLGLFA